jgi:pimeloyl-ACP methyl ester carboxylesterase
MLLTEASFSELQLQLEPDAWSIRTEVHGGCHTFDAELVRLAHSVELPQVWIGHSLGAIAAINLAFTAPEKCAAIICIASTARADAPSNRDQRLARLRRAHSAQSCEPISLEMKPVFGLVAGSALAKSLSSQAASVGSSRFANQTEYALTRPDRSASIVKFTCPILAIVGSDDDICPPALSQEIVALSAPAHATRVVQIAGAGHLAPMTHAQEIAAHITQFLTRL